MSFILGFFAVGLVSLTTVVIGLRKAPEAYEDDEGFHIISQPARELSGAPSPFLKGPASAHGRYWNIVRTLFRSGGPTEQPRPRISART